jgi:A/G-specific adenine glycosylase
MDNRYFSDKVVEWYQGNHRKLPWRETRDPYRIWLSEVILQQTRVSQGLPYYTRFVERYPRINDLAAASEQEVLRLWQGLGYYSRARNLIKCAKAVVARHCGLLPDTPEELKSLPGIGDYTAAAIASFAFGRPVAVLDGNVFRVLARFFGLEHDVTKVETRKLFTRLANQLVDKSSPDVYNQAIMEFGALCCTPKSPRCSECVLSANCVAANNNLQATLPIKERKKVPRKRYFYYFVIMSKDRIAMKRRSEKDIWRNLYDFYLLEPPRRRPVKKLIENDLWLKKITRDKPQIEISSTYKHNLTHQAISAKFITLYPSNETSERIRNMRFYSKKGIEKLPKPILISRYLADQKIL